MSAGEHAGLVVAYDLRGTQNPEHPERGIARYCRSQIAALARAPGIERLVGLVDPALADPGVPGPAVELMALEEARSLLEDGRVVVHHIASPFEMRIPFARMLPPAFRTTRVARVATLFDVIPLAWGEPGPGRDEWRARATLVTTAELVACISAFTAEDAAHRLGLRPERARVVGTGVEPPLAAKGGDPAGVEGDYVLYVGGTEHPRKNLETLVRAFGRAGAHAEGCRLVVVGRMHPTLRRGLEREALRAGVGDRLVLTGYVGDTTLAALYRGCRCAVYPSLYEGFGLPVVDAMAHGAPVVYSSTTSLGEIPAVPGATFRPEDEAGIATAIARVLDDPGHAERLRAHGLRTAPAYRWDAVAERTVAVYREAADRRRRRLARAGEQRTLTLVLTSVPEPASPCGAALLLAGAASRRASVHVATNAPLAPRGGKMGPLSPRRRPGAPTWRPGPLAWVVGRAEDAVAAESAMRGRGGVALVWEPEAVAGDPAGAGALRALAAAADALVAPDAEGAAALRGVAGEAARVCVIPPPLGWTASEGRLGRRLPFEAAVMLGPGRAAARAGRPRPLVLCPMPPRFGRLGEEELRRRGELALALASAPGRPRVAAIGDADPGAADAILRWVAVLGAPGGLAIAPWPEFQELVIWVTAADAVADPLDSGRAASRAIADLAATGARPLVAAQATGDLAAGLADALGARDAIHSGPPSERTPRAAADALLSLVGLAPAAAA